MTAPAVYKDKWRPAVEPWRTSEKTKVLAELTDTVAFLSLAEDKTKAVTQARSFCFRATNGLGHASFTFVFFPI
jgi:hypothetical protein